MRSLFAVLSLAAFSALFGAGCALQPPKLDLPAKTLALKMKPQSFISHADWIGLPLDFQEFDELRKDVETQISKPLKNRGEAHITLLTPPEFANLKNQLSMKQLEEIVKPLLPPTSISAVCLGTGKKDSMKTYFVVVRSQELLQIRQVIKAQAEKLNSKPVAFDPSHFYPHVTLGYTDRDLHEADGVVKDSKACEESL